MTNEQINRTLAEWMGKGEVTDSLTEAVLYHKNYSGDLRYTSDWNELAPVWVKFRDMVNEKIDGQTPFMQGYLKGQSNIESIGQAILNNNTPEPAAKLLAQAVVELKLLTNSKNSNMGMFDTVWVKCPICGEEAGFQTKSGDCTLENYNLADAPDRVMIDVNRHAPEECEQCGCFFEVDIPNRQAIVVTKHPQP